MPSFFTEDTFEQAVIELFEHMGYTHIYAPDMDRDYTSPLLDAVLRDSLVRINKGLAPDAIDEAISKLKNLWTQLKCLPLAAHSRKRKSSENTN